MRCLLILLLCVACAPQSTVPFQPGSKVSVAEEIAKQFGNKIYSGMYCDDYCRITQSCNIRQRINARMNPGSACKVRSADALRYAIKWGRH